MRYHVTVGDVTFEVEIDAQGVRVGGDRMEASGPELGECEPLFLSRGRGITYGSG